MLDEIYPLSTEIYNRALELGVTKIILQFEGGSDEGYCNVEAQRPDTEIEKEWRALSWEVRNEREKAQDPGYWQFKKTLQEIWDFESKVEDWAWDHYHYSGAGDGSRYGDNVSYDLVEKKITTQEWYTPDPAYEEEYDVSNQVPFVATSADDQAGDACDE